MATNLLYGYPEIPAAATVTTDFSVDSSYPAENLFGGSRFDICQRAAAASGNHLFKFDLGAGVTKSANYLIIGRAKLLQSCGVTTVRLRAHTSDAFTAATEVYANTSFDTAALYGPNGDDFIVTFNPSSAFRWWFVRFESSSSTLLSFSKLYFGTALDLGRDPEYGMEISRPRLGVYGRRPLYKLRLPYRGVSFAKTRAFIDEVIRQRDSRPAYLFTRSGHQTLNNHRLLFAAPTEFDYPTILQNRNDMDLVFDEVA